MAKSSRSGPVRRRHVTESDSNDAGPSRVRSNSLNAQGASSGLEDNGDEHGAPVHSDVGSEGESEEREGDFEGFGDGMDLEGFSGPSEKVVKPLTPEALAAFRAAKEKTGVIYISRIPPGMRPTKVRHLMSQYGEVGKVYLQQEGEYPLISRSQCAHIYLTRPIFRRKEGVP